MDGAIKAAGWLEASMLDAPVHASPDFGDRVMAALEAEPTPAPAGFLSPVRRRGIAAGFAASLRQAWASAFSGGRPVLVRASALAYVLAVVLAGTALAGFATVGIGSALGLLGPSATQTVAPATTAPTDLAVPSGLEPPATMDPDASLEPGESDPPGATDDHEGGSGADASDEHEGDGGALSGSTDGSDDHSSPNATDSSSDDHEGGTPRPSSTPEPSGTPRPTQTASSGGDG
jgi:hypothetical protein